MRAFSVTILCASLACVAVHAETPSAPVIAERLRSFYATIDDYQCKMREHCTVGAASEKRVMNFYFKRPRFLRMDVVEGNRTGDSGATCIFRNDGRVTVKPGGLFSFLVATLAKDDPRIASIRGMAIDQIDLHAVIDELSTHANAGECAVEARDGAYVVTVNPRVGPVTREIIRLDASTLLPISTDSWEGATIVQHAEWSAFILNAGLPDALFDVHWDPRGLTAMGVRSVLDARMD